MEEKLIVHLKVLTLSKSLKAHSQSDKYYQNPANTIAPKYRFQSITRFLYKLASKCFSKDISNFKAVLIFMVLN